MRQSKVVGDDLEKYNMYSRYLFLHFANPTSRRLMGNSGEIIKASSQNRTGIVLLAFEELMTLLVHIEACLNY